MKSGEKQASREELEKESLTTSNILAIKRFHEAGRTNSEIAQGMDLFESTVGAALSRQVKPVDGDQNA